MDCVIPAQDATAEECVNRFINESLRCDTTRKIINDKGAQFVSKVMFQVVYCLAIHQSLTPVYHPASNTEDRKNRDLKTQLSIFMKNNHNRWDELLPSVRFTKNIAVCAVTGYTPAYLNFACELPMNTETYEL